MLNRVRRRRSSFAGWILAHCLDGGDIDEWIGSSEARREERRLDSMDAQDAWPHRSTHAAVSLGFTFRYRSGLVHVSVDPREEIQDLLRKDGQPIGGKKPFTRFVCRCTNRQLAKIGG